MIISIKKWALVFENADTRKRQRLGWILSPTGCDSKGYRKLMRHGTDGVLALGVFQAMCQLMGTLPINIRGKLTNSDGSGMELPDIAEMLRMEVAVIQQAIGILEECGWISVESATTLPGPCCDHAGDLPVSAGDLPVGRKSLKNQPNAGSLPPSAGTLPEHCRDHPAFVQGEGKGEGEGEVVGSHAPGRSAPPPQEPVADAWEDLMPTETARDFGAVQEWINSLLPPWRKRPTFTFQEMRDLQANAKIFFELSADDKALLGVYMNREIPEEWGKFYKTFSRGKFIQDITDVLTAADRWKQACKRYKVATGLEGGGK